jgi:hypothetical protein
VLLQSAYKFFVFSKLVLLFILFYLRKYFILVHQKALTCYLMGYLFTLLVLTTEENNICKYFANCKYGTKFVI